MGGDHTRSNSLAHAAGEINAAENSGVIAAWEQGKRLLAIKAHPDMKHGQFEAWCDAHLVVKERQRQKYIALAKAHSSALLIPADLTINQALGYDDAAVKAQKDAEAEAEAKDARDEVLADRLAQFPDLDPVAALTALLARRETENEAEEAKLVKILQRKAGLKKKWDAIEKDLRGGAPRADILAAHYGIARKAESA